MEDQTKLDPELAQLVSYRDVDRQKLAVSQMTVQRFREVIQHLRLILHKSDDFSIKDKIALFFYEFGDDSLVDDLIEEIRKEENQGHYGTLIFACSAFDCSEYLRLFADRVIAENYEVAMSALDVIENMKKGFDENELQSVLESLRNKTKDESIERKENIEDAILYLMKFVE